MSNKLYCVKWKDNDKIGYSDPMTFENAHMFDENFDSRGGEIDHWVVPVCSKESNGVYYG